MRRMRNNNLEIRIAGSSCRIVFNFFWDLQSPQEKLTTMLMQNVGAWWTTKSIMVFFEKGLFK